MPTRIGVTPKSLYLTALALVILVTRPLSGKLADRIGYRRVFMPCLVLIAVGLAMLALGSTRLALVASAMSFGVGFGTAYPVFVAYVMRDVYAARRGAAFGAILAAFDTGIGTGSTTVGWLIQRFGFSDRVRRRRRALRDLAAVFHRRRSEASLAAPRQRHEMYSMQRRVQRLASDRVSRGLYSLVRV